jgi:hypothetical protein
VVQKIIDTMFKFILIVLFFLFVFPSIFRFLLKLFIAKQVNKAQDEFYRQQRASQKREGQINVDYVPDDLKNKKDFGGGEYIDYEEVK